MRCQADVIPLNNRIRHIGDDNTSYCGTGSFETSSLYIPFDLPGTPRSDATLSIEETNLESSGSEVQINGERVGTLPPTGSNCTYSTHRLAVPSRFLKGGRNSLRIRLGLNGSSADDIDDVLFRKITIEVDLGNEPPNGTMPEIPYVPPGYCGWGVSGVTITPLAFLAMAGMKRRRRFR